MADHKPQANTDAFEAMIRSMVISAPGSQADLSTKFRLTGLTPTPGEWYFGATCKACGRTSPAFRDASSGKLGRVFVGKGSIAFPCQDCGQEIEAGPEAIVSFRMP